MVAYHSNSLIYHVNNNCVETYNSVVAKYIGGKRVNFSLRGNVNFNLFIIQYYIIFISQNNHRLFIFIKFVGSYNARCNTAVSAYNYGPDYLHKYYKNSTNYSPGKYTKKFIAKEIKKKYNVKQKLLNQTK